MAGGGAGAAEGCCCRGGGAAEASCAATWTPVRRNLRGAETEAEEHDEGHTGVRNVYIRLQVGPIRPNAYTMAYFRFLKSCNGMCSISRIVMADFQTLTIVIAYIQLTLS